MNDSNEISDQSPWDVVVLGSGGAGLSAALAAGTNGARVLVLERAAVVGGTTAVSGGGLWVPGARALIEAGIDTPAELSRSYLLGLAGERADPARVEVFLRAAPSVLDEIERLTPIRWQPSWFPDYHPELPGGSPDGHCVEVVPFDAPAVLGDRFDRVRTTPFFPGPFTLAELREAGGWARFADAVGRDELRARAARGVVAMGRGLAAGLYAGCLAAGVAFRTEARAAELVPGPRGETFEVSTDDGLRIGAAAAVVATGGFEWNPDLQRAWLAGPPLAPASPPYNTGDGIILGQSAGGTVAGTQEAWWYPVVELPGDAWPERQPIRRLTSGERSNPGSIMVNRSGRRFCNESSSYHVIGRTMLAPDPSGIGWANVPAWVVFDAGHRGRYQVQTAAPGRPDPDWLRPASSLEELARREGIDPPGLESTVARFNHDARRGLDTEFGRGGSAYDRLMGDPSAPHPCLGPVEQPPFYALRVHPGTIGTKGGLAVNGHGAVLDGRGRIVAGLFAAGNASVNVTGEGYPGAGGTLGPAVVSGWLAGRAAARGRQR